MARIGELNLNEFIKKLAFSERRHRQQALKDKAKTDTIQVLKIVENIKKKAEEEGKGGFLSGLVDALPFGGKELKKFLKGAAGIGVSMVNPIAGLGLAIDEYATKKKTLKKKEKALSKMPALPSSIKGTFTESQALGALSGATAQTREFLKSQKKVTDMMGIFDIGLSLLPVLKGPLAGVKDVAKLTEVVEGGVSTTLGQPLTDKLGAVLDTLVTQPKGYIQTGPMPISSPMGDFIRIAKGKKPLAIPFPKLKIPLPSIHQAARQFQPSLQDMLLGEPGDIRLTEFEAPTLNRRRY